MNLPIFLAQIASVKQWSIFYRESSVEKGPGGVTICFYFSTWQLAPMRVPCFRKTPLYHKQELLFIKGNTFTDFASDFPEGDRCACCWPAMAPMHETRPIHFAQNLNPFYCVS